jgi:hypothetical protein
MEDGNREDEMHAIPDPNIDADCAAAKVIE